MKNYIFPGTPTPNLQFRYHSCFRVPTATAYGRLSAAVSAGTITHNRTPHAQRFSLPTELSGDVGACQRSFSLSCQCVTVTAVSLRRYRVAAVHQLCCSTVCFFFVAMRNILLPCIMMFALSSWLPLLDITNVCTAVCQPYYPHVKHT